MNNEGDEVAAFVADIEGMDAQIDLLESQKRERLAAFALTARTIKDSNAEFDFLYWTLLSVQPSLLAKAFGRHLKSFKIAPIGTGIPCEDCGIEMMADSRSRLYTIHAWLVQGVACRCPACWQTRSGQRSVADQQAEWWRRQNELRSMLYSEYLRTPEWRDKRKSALSRALYRCQLCNVNGNDENVILQVHHRTYENLGRELSSDLIVLCKPCHYRHHRHFDPA